MTRDLVGWLRNNGAEDLSELLVIRPSGARHMDAVTTARGSRLASAASFATCGIAFAATSSAWWFAGGLLGSIGFLLAWLTLYLRNAAVFAYPQYVGTVSALGRIRKVRADRIARVVIGRIAYSFSPGSGRPEMYFLDSNGRTLLQVKGSGWRSVDLAAVWRRMGLTPDGSFDDIRSLHALRHDVPVSWLRRHQAAVGIAAMLVVVFLLTLLIDRLGLKVTR